MRISTLILCLLFGIVSASAKDVITKTDGTRLDAKVEEITETLIKYRIPENPSGPLYSIQKSSVVSIAYENGYIENYSSTVSSETAHPAEAPQTFTPSDEELMRMAESQPIPTPESGYVSDTELLRMYYNGSNPASLQRKAKTYRLVGWIGGVLMFSAGLCVGIFVSDDFHENGYLAAWTAMGLGAGGLWCLGFNLKANSLMKQARRMQSFSFNIFENEIMQIGDNSLTAGINLMGNRISNLHSLGLSLGLNF